jgi:F-type H+-transporting ATPase subunit a
MSDPILHIKDSYFFHVPTWLWHHHWQKLSDVPQFLRDEHPEIKDARQFDEAMAGKVLIRPQPFGTQKNLFERKSGFLISKFMILELFVAIVVAVVFIRLAARARKGDRPKGTIWNMLEAMLVYLRDEVARPSIGEHDADRFVPLLWTLFFFILGCNLMGLVPWAGSPTAAASVTLALALVTFLTGIIMGVYQLGPIGWVAHFVPHMEMSLPLKIILWPFIFVLEIAGTIIRHAVLGVRLLANMVAGHLVLLGILGLITIAAAASIGHMGQWTAVTVIAVIGAVLLSCLELFVAFLQAYVFVFLSALFIGASIHKH